MRRWLGVTAVAAGVALLWVWRAPPPDRPGAPSEGGRPWQVETLPDGAIRAIGLVPGQSTLGGAIGRFGKGLEAAVFESAGQGPVLEAYWSEVTSGGITGRLIVTLDASAEVVRGLQARGTRTTGMGSPTVRYALHPRDGEVVASLAIRSLTFVPTANLEAATVRARFGEPEDRLPGGEGVTHWLYPRRGIAVTLNAQGRELIDYVDPRDFGWLRDTLVRKAPAARP
jgi:hypothetical protein